MVDSSYTITVCQPQERSLALSLALRPLPINQRGLLVESLESLTNEPLGSFDALIVAHRGSQLIAASWVQPQPGRTASLWLPEFASKIEPKIAAGMIQRASQIADQCGVSMTQVLLEVEDHPLAMALTRNQFIHIAKLLYLEWPGALGTPTVARPLRTDIEFESHAGEHIDRLRRVVQSTYVDTLDCPRLEGLRNLADTLAGYRQVGQYDPALWYLLRRDERDLGVLLLAEHPSSNQMELVYMGIPPYARGDNLGAEAILKAQLVTSQRGSERLVLAVDAANRPAVRIYQQAGFTEWAERVVMVRPRSDN